ncbi:MAG: hypothetical protein M3O70_19160 [Actinomycetota bacterium]|nr:hypothetical protein [Actinomycetota bacterium]
MEADRDHIDRILERLEVLRAGVDELDRLHSSVRAEIDRLNAEAEPIGVE